MLKNQNRPVRFKSHFSSVPSVFSLTLSVQLMSLLCLQAGDIPSFFLIPCNNHGEAAAADKLGLAVGLAGIV